MLLDEMKKLQKDGLVIGKCHKTKPWTLFKYHNKVFYDNLWHVSDALLEARGIVITDDGEIIQRPFHKCFNVGENGTQMPTTNYEAYRKINGFMAAASWLDGELIVTTTGSFDSNYQKLAYNYLELPMNDYKLTGTTLLFEICDNSDPHIVDEVEGAYLLSARIKESGEYASQDWCHSVAKGIGVFCPQKELYDIKAQHEGWMFYDRQGTPLTKVKTPHYLSKKALMRMGKKQAQVMFESPQQFRNRLDEEFYDLFDHLLDSFTQEDYIQLNEQQRRAVIEEYFNA